MLIKFVILFLYCLFFVKSATSSGRIENGEYIFTSHLTGENSTNTVTCGNYASVVTFSYLGFHKIYIFELYGIWRLSSENKYYVSSSKDINENSNKDLIHGEISFNEDCTLLQMTLAGTNGFYHKILNNNDDRKFGLVYSLDGFGKEMFGWSNAITGSNDFYRAYVGAPMAESAKGNALLQANILYHSIKQIPQPSYF